MSLELVISTHRGEPNLAPCLAFRRCALQDDHASAGGGTRARWRQLQEANCYPVKSCQINSSNLIATKGQEEVPHQEVHDTSRVPVLYILNTLAVTSKLKNVRQVMVSHCVSQSRLRNACWAARFASSMAPGLVDVATSNCVVWRSPMMAPSRSSPSAWEWGATRHQW